VGRFPDEGRHVLRAGVQVKYGFILAHRAQFTIRTMCRVLGVHFSGFYTWVKNPLSPRAIEDRRQTKLIEKAWKDSGKIYGYPLAGRALQCNVPRGVKSPLSAASHGDAPAGQWTISST